MPQTIATSERRCGLAGASGPAAEADATIKAKFANGQIKWAGPKSIERFDNLALSPGQRVYVSPTNVRVFAQPS